MKFYLNWLKEYINIDEQPEEIASKLTLAGVEVGECKMVGGGIENVISAEIIKVKNHPNADKLSVCQVSNGREILSVVCGANNIKEKDRVPLAMVGAELPGGLKIKKSKIRGELSCGMLCSGKELNISSDADGIHILPKDTPLGRDVSEYLNLKNHSFELEITPNRADLLGMLGVARELGAITGRSIKYPDIPKDDGIKLSRIGNVSVEVHDNDLCPRYTAAIVKNIKVKESPDWIKRRLEGAGIRSLNNIVDITNFVMLEWGQPLHAFDLSKISGKTIVVRKAKTGEKLKTLDGKIRELEANDIAICDERKPVALGGIMGGEESEISNETKDILIESALFNSVSIRRTSQKLSLSSDSSYRFERGVDPQGVRKALLRAVSLMEKYAEGKQDAGIIDVYPKEIKPVKIILKSSKVAKVIGVDIPPAKIKSILDGLQIEVKNYGDVDFEVTVPTFRGDIKEDIDLIEEIARIYGYHLIPTTLPDTLAEPDFFPKDEVLYGKISQTLIGCGFLEAKNYTFIAPKDNKIFTGSDADFEGSTLRVHNPISEEMSVMRQNILPSLLGNLSHNVARGSKNAKIFELDKTFHIFNQKCTERHVLGLVMTGEDSVDRWDSKSRKLDFFDIKGVFEEITQKLYIDKFSFTQGSSKRYFHPKASIDIMSGEKFVGSMGLLHPDILDHFKLDEVYALEIILDELITIYDENIKVSTYSKFPTVERDIALIIDANITHEKIISTINAVNSDLIKEIQLFDLYKGGQIPQGKKSLAYRIIFQSADRTLKEEEVEKIQEQIVSKLKQELGAELR